MSNEKVNGQKPTFFERREPANEEQLEKAPVQEKAPENTEQPQGPKVAHQLTVTVFEDGNAQVNGPFHDRITFHGMLALAANIEHEMWRESRAKAAAQANARAVALAKEPWFKRKMRERAEQKAAEKALQAQGVAAAIADAEVQQNDELTKALADNAKKPS